MATRGTLKRRAQKALEEGKQKTRDALSDGKTISTKSSTPAAVTASQSTGFNSNKTDKLRYPKRDQDLYQGQVRFRIVELSPLTGATLGNLNFVDELLSKETLSKLDNKIDKKTDTSPIESKKRTELANKSAQKLKGSGQNSYENPAAQKKYAGSVTLYLPTNHVVSDAVVDALLEATDGDESEEVRKFAEYSASLSPASTGDDAKLFQLARRYRSLLLKGISTLLIGMNYHAEVTGDVLTEFAIKVVNDDKRKEEGEKEVTVKDAKHFDDPENVPEEVGLVKLTSMVCDLLKQFGASGEKVLNELEKRCSYHEQFWKLTRYDITPRHTLIDKFKGMLEIYKSDTWQESNNMRPIDQTDELWVLQTFLDKAASSVRFSQSICNLLDEQFSIGGPTSLALSRECIALEPTLPKGALRFVQAGKSFERLEDVAAKIAAGKQIVSLL